MSSDWCRIVEDQLSTINKRIENIEAQNAQLLKVVVIGLLAIVGAVVGLNLAGLGV
jgi:hypothetical protein